MRDDNPDLTRAQHDEITVQLPRDVAAMLLRVSYVFVNELKGSAQSVALLRVSDERIRKALEQG